MAALRDRLGAFEMALPPSVPAPMPARAVDESAATLRAYLDERREHCRERDTRRARATREQRGEWRELADRHQKERADIFRGSWRGKGDLLNATRSLLAARQARRDATKRHSSVNLAVPRWAALVTVGLLGVVVLCLLL